MIFLINYWSLLLYILENNAQALATRNSRSRKQSTTNNATKSSARPVDKKIPDIVVHSPLKSRPDVVPSRVASPLKTAVRLERTGSYREKSVFWHLPVAKY
jgi:hypothetical protein